MTPTERDAFARHFFARRFFARRFFAPEYNAQLAFLRAFGLMDTEE